MINSSFRERVGTFLKSQIPSVATGHLIKTSFWLEPTSKQSSLVRPLWTLQHGAVMAIRPQGGLASLGD